MSAGMRRQLSPTAQLLRSSRLFSIPKPLPAPNMDVSVSGTLKSSKTATIPYPTHQAIATPASSLGRGDWGLKRPLPLKSTKRTSRPVLRILTNDTIEHITDFDSAQDHVQTLQKWHEMGVGLSYGGKRERDPSSTTVGQKGVFERQVDSTDPEDEFWIDYKPPVQDDKASAGSTTPRAFKKSLVKRWKHKGPWLASLDAKSFETYIKKEVGKRRQEFREYFDQHIRQKIMKARKAEAQREGWNIESVSEEISEEDLKAHYRLFRQGLQENQIMSELVHNVVIPFLDLPPVDFEADKQISGPIWKEMTLGHNTEPLTTHPSAGLSYLRSNTSIYNHPLLGPQQYKQPVPARVLIPAKTSTGGRGRAVLGVAGIAVDDSETGANNGGSSYSSGIGVAFLDTETEGGKKIWVSPRGANIRSDGKIILDITRAAREAVEVSLGHLEEAPPPGIKKAPSIVGLGGARLDEALV